MAWTLLDTTHTFSRLIGLLRNAKSTVMLVSPYFDLGADDRVGQEIRHALGRGVRVVVVVRSDSRPSRHDAWRAAMKAHVQAGLQLYEVDWLHAKIYCSESEGIVSSLNLLRSSVTNSIEVGLHTTDVTALTELKRLIANEVLRLKKAVSLEDAEARLWAPAEPRPAPAPAQRAASRAGSAASSPRRGSARPVFVEEEEDDDSALGYCIRCGDEVDFEPERPYCAEHYRSWAKYRNEDYEECFCHSCGEEHDATMARPQCVACYRANR